MTISWSTENRTVKLISKNTIKILLKTRVRQVITIYTVRYYPALLVLIAVLSTIFIMAVFNPNNIGIYKNMAMDWTNVKPPYPEGPRIRPATMLYENENSDANSVPKNT